VAAGVDATTAALSSGADVIYQGQLTRAPAGRTRGRAAAVRTGASPLPGSPGSTPGPRMSARTRCTKQPPACPPVRDGGYRGPECGRDDPQPAAGPRRCDQWIGQARRMLEYKTRWNGGRLVLAAICLGT
jgi:hypothetical protein